MTADEIDKHMTCGRCRFGIKHKQRDTDLLHVAAGVDRNGYCVMHSARVGYHWRACDDFEWRVMPVKQVKAK